MYLVLNGFNIPIQSAVETEDINGTRGRSLCGGLFTNTVGPEPCLHSWEFATPPVPMDEARAIRSLLRPECNGTVFNGSFDIRFEDIPNNITFGYPSSKGHVALVGPGNGTDQWDTAGDGRFFPGGSPTGHGIYNDGGGAANLPLMTIDSSCWTVAVHYDDDIGVWEHQILTSDGDKWVDNVSAPGATLALDVVNNIFVLKGANSGNFDDAVFFPFVIPDSWAETWDTTTEFSSLPQLNASGCFYEKEALVQCEAVTINHVPVPTSASSCCTYGQVSFRLRLEGNGVAFETPPQMGGGGAQPSNGNAPTEGEGGNTPRISLTAPGSPVEEYQDTGTGGYSLRFNHVNVDIRDTSDSIELTDTGYTYVP